MSELKIVYDALYFFLNRSPLPYRPLDSDPDPDEDIRISVFLNFA